MELITIFLTVAFASGGQALFEDVLAGFDGACNKFDALLAESPNLEFTVTLPTGLTDAAKAAESFRRVVGEMESPLFWARWQNGQRSFVQQGTDSFKVHATYHTPC